MVYRATRGNGIVMFDDLEYPLRDSKTGEFVDKVVFRLLLIGEKQGPLSAKLNRICDSFGARKMPVNDNEYEMNQRYN